MEQYYGKRKRTQSVLGKVSLTAKKLKEASRFENSDSDSFAEMVKNMSPLWREFYLKFEAKIKKN